MASSSQSQPIFLFPSLNHYRLEQYSRVGGGAISTISYYLESCCWRLACSSMCESYSFIRRDGGDENRCQCIGVTYRAGSTCYLL